MHVSSPENKFPDYMNQVPGRRLIYLLTCIDMLPLPPVHLPLPDRRHSHKNSGYQVVPANQEILAPRKTCPTLITY